jgi:hypothetical protein
MHIRGGIFRVKDISCNNARFSMRLVIIVTYKIIFLQTDEMHVFWNHVSSVPTPNVRTYFLATLLKKFKQ